MYLKPLHILVLFLCVLLLFARLEKAKSSPSLPKTQEPLLQEHGLSSLFLHAIESAQESILLASYSLSDPILLSALQKRAEAGIETTVVYDPSTSGREWSRLGKEVRQIARKGLGLTHQKLLVVDKELLCIGSANASTESLRWHDNLVLSCLHRELATLLVARETELAPGPLPPTSELHPLKAGEQDLEFWQLPMEGEAALKRLIALLEGAEQRIQVAMFTWTHSALTEAVIAAHRRGVHVTAILDRTSANGTSYKTFRRLQEAGVPVRAHRGSPLLHHKLCIIDETILVMGSTNWTQAAFTKNRDCFVVLSPLTQAQRKRLQRAWKRI